MTNGYPTDDSDLYRLHNVHGVHQSPAVLPNARGPYDGRLTLFLRLRLPLGHSVHVLRGYGNYWQKCWLGNEEGR